MAQAQTPRLTAATVSKAIRAARSEGGCVVHIYEDHIIISFDDDRPGIDGLDYVSAAKQREWNQIAAQSELLPSYRRGLDPLMHLDLTDNRPRRPPLEYSTGKHIPKPVRREVLARDGNICGYCGCVTDDPHLDHILPRSRGGLNSPDNLCVACEVCNKSKGRKTPDEWNGRRMQ